MSAFDRLIAAAGSWRGTSTLQDPHAGLADESASTATVTPVLDGRFVRIDYTWSYRGTPQEGSLLIGFQKKAGTATAHWIDSFHNGDKVMACSGPASDGAVTVRGSYAAPPGPDWGWRIDVTPGGDTLRIVHHNVWPEGKEELAVDSTYTRA
ncbi:MAG TPA: DUF1579 family protein [Longimicrobium sp.]|nr:DUF1579 family protein [Longimicrobium sp.]